jgi:hypothetical protein
LRDLVKNFCEIGAEFACWNFQLARTFASSIFRVPVSQRDTVTSVTPKAPASAF